MADAFGTEDQIYLLRTDTSGARYRILGDILSIVENRIIATRTFLDLPRQEAGRLFKTLWSPDGAWLLVTMVHFEGKSQQMFRTHVIVSQTGLPLRMPESKPFLDNHRAVAFSNDGSRLFLLHDNPDASLESETGRRSLVVLKTQSGEREVIPIPDLPPLAPLEISDDGTWAAYYGARSSNYARSSNVEIWNTRTGKKTATLPPTYRGQYVLGFKVDMFAGGDFIAVADQRTLSVYATKTGRRLSRFPDVPPDDQLPFLPLFLSHNTTQLVFIGMGSTVTDSDDSGLWMHRILFDKQGEID